MAIVCKEGGILPKFEGLFLKIKTQKELKKAEKSRKKAEKSRKYQQQQQEEKNKPSNWFYKH